MKQNSIYQNRPINAIERSTALSEPGFGVIDIYFSYEEYKGSKIVKILSNCGSDLIVDFGNAVAKLNKSRERLSNGVISVWSRMTEIGPFQTKRYKTRDNIKTSQVEFKLEDNLLIKPQFCYRPTDFENYGEILRLPQVESKDDTLVDEIPSDPTCQLSALMYDRHNTMWKAFTRWSLNTTIRSIKWSEYISKGFHTNKRYLRLEKGFSTYIKMRYKQHNVESETRETITILCDGLRLNLRKRFKSFELMNSVIHVPQWKILSDKQFIGMEKNVIACLKNLYKLSVFPKDDSTYYIRNGRGFILLKKITDVEYSEINTKMMRISENLQMCDHYEKTLKGYFQRTKYPIKPYGKLYHNLVSNYKCLPSQTYSEAVQMPINEIKKHYWCKIYHASDRRNQKLDDAKIIRNPCWNYTKFISVNSYLFDNDIVLILDKSRRTKINGPPNPISKVITADAIERRNDHYYNGWISRCKDMRKIM